MIDKNSESFKLALRETAILADDFATLPTDHAIREALALSFLLGVGWVESKIAEARERRRDEYNR